MITGVFGLPGAGKTTFLARTASIALAGKPLYIGHGLWRTSMSDVDKYNKVYSNYPIKGCYKLDPKTVGLYEYKDALLLIDEISLLWSNRNWAKFSEDVANYMSLHRHYHTDIIYCGQSYRDCDVKIRDRTESVMHIQASRIPGYTKITPLAKYMDVVNDQIAEGYTLPPAPGVTRIRRKKYWHLFDSYERPQLPPLPDDQMW